MFNLNSVYSIMKNIDNLSPEDRIILSQVIGQVSRRAKNIDIYELHAITEYTDHCMWIYIIVKQEGKMSIKHRIGIGYSDLKNIDKYVTKHIELTVETLGISFNELKYTTDHLKK